MILRILNKTWAKIFGVASSILLFIVGIIYYLLICNSLFIVLEFIFLRSGFTNYENKSTGNVVWDKFSIQYLALIAIVPISPMLFISNMKGIVKLADYGFVAIASFVVFIFYIFFKNVCNKSVDFSGITLWNWDPSGPLGNFSLAFMVHNAISQIIKTNKVKSNNCRDLAISYTCATGIYGLIGIFGAFGIYGLTASNPNTI